MKKEKKVITSEKCASSMFWNNFFNEIALVIIYIAICGIATGVIFNLTGVSVNVVTRVGNTLLIINYIVALLVTWLAVIITNKGIIKKYDISNVDFDVVEQRLLRSNIILTIVGLVLNIVILILNNTLVSELLKLVITLALQLICVFVFTKYAVYNLQQKMNN